MVTILFSKNKFYDVMAPFFVHDVVALNMYAIKNPLDLSRSAGCLIHGCRTAFT